MFITILKRIIAIALLNFVLVSESLAYPCSVFSEPWGASYAGVSSAMPQLASSAMPQLGVQSTDPVGPFPLSALVRFPWSTIRGIWSMKLPNGTPLHLSLEVQLDCEGRKYIEVIGFDQKTYRITAEGIGLGSDDDTIVRIPMISSATQFMIYIRQFRVPVGKASSKIATVVTVRPFDGSPESDVHMVARKASPLTLSDYILQQKAIQRKHDLVKAGSSLHRTSSSR